MTELFWTEERIAKAQKHWEEGLPARAIADLLGSTKNTVISMAHRNRERFPERQKSRQAIAYEAPGRKVYPDRVKRTTISGAVVTMPRVPTIDGPAPIVPQVQRIIE